MTGKHNGLVFLVVLATAAALSAIAWGANEADTWIATFEGLDYGAFFDVVLTGDEAMLAVGATVHPLGATTRGDVLIAKTTMNGELMWERTYGGDAMDQAFCIVPADDGGYLVLGETDSFGAGGRDLYLLKIDPAGDLLWSETYGGGGTEWAKDLIGLSGGGFLVVGETDSFGDSFDAFVVRIDPDGAIVWQTTLGNDTDDETGVAALEAENGELLVLAGVSYPGGYEGNRRDSRLFRLHADGQEVWSSLYRGDVKQWGNDLVSGPDGTVVIVGIAEPVSGSESPLDFWIAKASAETGELIWSRTEGSQYQDDYGVSVTASSGGGYVVAGFGPGLPMLKFDDDGRLMWLRNAVSWRSWVIYGGFSIVESSDGTLVVPGWVYIGDVEDDFDAVLARIDSQGRISH